MGQKCPKWPKMQILGQIWPFLGGNPNFFWRGSKSFGTHLSVNQHYLENHSTPFQNHANYLEKTWKPTENCENMQKVLIFATHMSPNWISWKNDQFWPLTSTCTWHAYPRICILQCIIYIDLNHYDHDDYHDLYDHHNQADSINTTQLQLQIYPPRATLRELCQPDLLAVPVAITIIAL